MRRRAIPFSSTPVSVRRWLPRAPSSRSAVRIAALCQAFPMVMTRPTCRSSAPAQRVSITIWQSPTPCQLRSSTQEVSASTSPRYSAVSGSNT